MCRGFLPTRGSLRERGADVDPICGLCEGKEETVEHLWLSCPVSGGFWFAHPLSLRVEEYSSVPEFLQDFLSFADDRSIGLWQTSSYALWEARNKLLFDGCRFSCEAVLQRATSMEVMSTSGVGGSRIAPAHGAQWMSPMLGFVWWTGTLMDWSWLRLQSFQ